MSAVLPAACAPDRSVGARLVERGEFAIAFVILFLMSGGLLAPLFSPDQNPDSVPWLRTIWLPVYGMVAVLLARDPLRASRVATGAVLGLILCGWAFASIRWSIHPDVTLRRSVALLFTTLFGLWLAAAYDWRRLVELLGGVFFMLAMGTWIAAIAFPAFGRQDPVHPGAWTGLWYEKNQLGWIMTHGVLACACAGVFNPRRAFVWGVGAALCAGAVVMSQSTTSLLGVAISLGGIAGLALLRRGGAVRLVAVWAAIAGAGAFVAVMTLAPELFFKLIGKDPSLTGRTDIWAAVLHRAELRPALGYGFGAFWTDKWGPAWFIRQEVKWEAPTAHNGWLDVLLQLGCVGVALAALHFLVSSAAAVMRAFRGPEGYWALLFMVIFALFSVSESTVMQYNGITWAIYIATGAKLLEWQGLSGLGAPRRQPVRLFPD